MNYDEMTREELRLLKNRLRLEAVALREEMLAISDFMSAKQAEEKATAAALAMNTPGAVMAEIEGVAAAADAGGKAP